VGALLFLASAFVFGLDSWYAFLHSLPVASQSALAQGRADWAKLQSAFGLIRVLGSSAALGWTVHCMLGAAVAMLLWKVWRSSIEFDLKAAALATAILLVTPYLFLYDLVVLAVAIAFLMRAGRSGGFLRGEMIGLGLACFLILLFPLVTAPVGFAAILVVALLIGRRVLVALALPGRSRMPVAAASA